MIATTTGTTARRQTIDLLALLRDDTNPRDIVVAVLMPALGTEMMRILRDEDILAENHKSQEA